MNWSATLTITNNTDYNLTVNHNVAGDLATIPPGDSWSDSTYDLNNNIISLCFWNVPNQWYMQGSLACGPKAGVYMDRGWMAPTDQTIKLVADANGIAFEQTQNGGATVLPWNDFEQGGSMSLTFAKI